MSSDLSLDPLDRFRVAQERARASEPEAGSAVVLATVGADGRPSARVVLMKLADHRGFSFFTNYESRKARELEACPHAALCFYWPSLGQQVRVEGSVDKLSPSESDAYFRERPRGSQIGAWASDQSRPLPSRQAMLARARELTERFEGEEVPRPAHWGGYLLRPVRMEFWYGRDDRLHERLVFERDGDAWTQTLLFP